MHVGVEAIPLMTKSYSGYGPAWPSRKWGEGLGVKRSLVLQDIWENPEERREVPVLGRVYENHG